MIDIKNTEGANNLHAIENLMVAICEMKTNSPQERRERVLFLRDVCGLEFSHIAKIEGRIKNKTITGGASRVAYLLGKREEQNNIRRKWFRKQFHVKEGAK